MSRVATQFYDAGNGDLIVNRVQNCTPIADECATRRSMGQIGGTEMRHAARLPAVVVERYCNMHGITFAEFMQSREHIKAMVNDPALQAFRIWQGRV